MIPISAIIPLVPLITKAFEAKKEGKKAVDVVKESSGLTEVAQAGYAAALYGIYTAIMTCSDTITIASLSCVSGDQWAIVASFVSMAYLRLRDKIKSA